MVRAVYDNYDVPGFRLTFYKDDLIKVIEKTSSLYWVGQLDGQNGSFPSTLVEVVTDGFAKVGRVQEAQNTGIQLEIGSIVRISDPYNRDWWQVEFGDQKGVFPSHALEIIDKKTLKAVSLFDFSSLEKEELDFKTNTVIIYVGSYDVHWFKGTIGNRTGLVPYRYVRFYIGDDAPGLRKPSIRKAKVAFAYYAVEPNELNLEVGKTVEIIEDMNDGWLKGRIGSVAGIFPGSFVEFIEKGKKAPKPIVEEGEKTIPKDDISSQLVCAICLEYAEEAVETSCCHNVFCKPCLEMVSTTCCPQCRNKFTIQVAHLARRIIGELEAQCPNDSCTVKTTRSELKYHLAKCEFRVYECNQCDFKGVKVKFARHLVNKHIDGVMESCKHFCKEY